MIQFILYHIILYNTILYHVNINQMIQYILLITYVTFGLWSTIKNKCTQQNLQGFINVFHLTYFKETVLHSKKSFIFVFNKTEKKRENRNFKIKTELVFSIILFAQCIQPVKMLSLPF